MKKVILLLFFACFSLSWIEAQEKVDNKDKFVLKVVDDVMSVCEAEKDTTLQREVVMESDSVKMYVVKVVKDESWTMDSLSTDDKKAIEDFVKVVASEPEGAKNKRIVTTVKSSVKEIKLDLDFDALGDSIVFDINLDSIQTK